MTYSYTFPGDTDKDTVRFLIQDTDPQHASEWQVTDEEIGYAISTWGPKYYNSLYYVASTLADTIAARYAREASYSADGVSVSLGPVGDQYRALAASLRDQHDAFIVGTGVDVGGMITGEGLIEDTKAFSFGKGMHDYIQAGNQEWGGVYPPDIPVSSPLALPEQEQIIEDGTGTP